MDSVHNIAAIGAQSNFSFLEGASHPEEMVTTAKDLGLSGLAMADRNTLAGAVRAHVAAKSAGAILAIGTRLVFNDGTPDILAFPAHRAGYGRLTRLLTIGNRRAPKGQCWLALNDLLDYQDGLNLILSPERGNAKAAATALDRLAAITRETLWVGASHRFLGDDRRWIERLATLASKRCLPMIALSDALYHTPARRPLADVLTCIREHTTLDRAGYRLAANAERHLKDPTELMRLFQPWPQALTQTAHFLGRCRFSLSELAYDYPDEVRAGYRTPQLALEAFTYAGAHKRYPDGIPPKVEAALRHELSLIAQLGYAPYFLTVHDIVQYAHGQGILAQGRGSAANSAVCYCLGVTEVDPARADLLFERFISAERKEPPDIDVDFEHERREEVIQYIYRRFGRERAGIAATVICYRGRSAIREAGKAFGLTEDVIAALAGTLWGWSTGAPADDDVRRLGLDPADKRMAQALRLAHDLIGFPRHLSQHVGGFVITRSRLDEVIPVMNGAMEDRTHVEWDKDDLDALGILKIDVLGLGMLTCIRKALHLMKDHYGLPAKLSAIPAEDPAVYAMLSRADSVGVFQVESRAQMTMLPRLKPREFYDLVIEVAIVRPGPIQGGMVHPYLRRRQGLEPVTFPKEELKEVLGKTMGVPLFQEQAMRIAIVAAGFTPSEADKLRRAMATFRRVGTIGTLRDKFTGGMIARGYESEFAERCFKQIEGFGEYGFPESHAASFALLVYISAWIKCHYPDVFAAALLNAQPLGFYAPAQIVRDAREHGVIVRPVDINTSDWDATLEVTDPPRAPLDPRHASQEGDLRHARALRLGLRQISGLREDHARLITDSRGEHGYDSIRDLWLRTGLEPATLQRLARADAFRSLGLDRRDAQWAVSALRRSGDKEDLPLFASQSFRALEPDAALPAMTPGAHVVADYRHLSLSLKAHPVSFLRTRLTARGMTMCDKLLSTRDGTRLTVAGLVLVRQRPGTASGVIFMTLEDETGTANIVVWPKMFERFRAIVLGSRFLSVKGRVQSESGVIHVIADDIIDLSADLALIAQGGEQIEILAHADEVKNGGSAGSARGPSAKSNRHQDTPAMAPAIAPLPANDSAPTICPKPAIQDVHRVLPSGRNFH